jgi:nucleoid DNA-binding protein
MGYSGQDKERGMNKSEIIRAVAKEVKVPAKDAEKIIESFLDIVCLSLSCGEEVLITNFGKFELRQRPAMIHRNPKSGEKVEVPAKVYLGFKPSGSLRERLNP